MEVSELKKISTQVRRDIVRMVTLAKSGHPGGSLGIADVMTALYFNVMKHNPSSWTRSCPGTDNFILSAGHMTPVYYSVLARSGYFPAEELATFRKFGSRLQGHPSIKKQLPGITQASGSLGQGISVAAGMALAKKINKESGFIYVLCGDGESEEGQIWEAAMFAKHHKLDNLIAITDWNGQQIDGRIEDVAGQDNLPGIWESFGWNVIVANGHDYDEILKSFDAAGKNYGTKKPTMILFKTTMGYGVDFMEGTHKWHGLAPSEEQCRQAMLQLEETLGDF